MLTLTTGWARTFDMRAAGKGEVTRSKCGPSAPAASRTSREPHQPREHTARERLMLMPVVRARGDALLGSGSMPSGLPSSIVSLDLRSWSLAECTAAMSSVRELPPSEPESSWVSLLSR